MVVRVVTGSDIVWVAGTKKPADNSAGFLCSSLALWLQVITKLFHNLDISKSRLKLRTLMCALRTSVAPRIEQSNGFGIGCGFESRQAYTNLEAPESPTGASLFGGGDIVGLRF